MTLCALIVDTRGSDDFGSGKANVVAAASDDERAIAGSDGAKVSDPTTTIPTPLRTAEVRAAERGERAVRLEDAVRLTKEWAKERAEERTA